MTGTAGTPPSPGQIEQLQPGLRRLLAPNPSPFTQAGTNTYIVGTRDLAVIDPGPQIEAHLEAILNALAPGQRITHILVTHAHQDHAPLARALSRACGAPVLAHGDALAGRSRIMQQLAATAEIGGGEGLDAGFRPDRSLADGEVLRGPDWQIEALWTPGHFGNHMCFAMGDVVFTGDLVMGWSTSLVSPPDGDLTDFMASCRRLLARPARLYLPGHGAPVDNPHERLTWLIRHREAREAALLSALAQGPATPRALAERIYTEIDSALLPAATRNVLAHLVDLTQRNLVSPEGNLHLDSRFHAI